MKRLCVFYYLAAEWIGRPVEWIVCKECQRRLQRGDLRISGETTKASSHGKKS